MSKTPLGFVALTSLKKSGTTSAAADPAAALAALRRIYFKTTARTIEHDFAHAIELLKSIESEDDRQKASVFMEGIAELRKEWDTRRAPPKRAARRKR